MIATTRLSLALVVGLGVSQILGLLEISSTSGGIAGAVRHVMEFLTMACLGFIMINVGRELALQKSSGRALARDYGVAMASATIPWLLCSALLMVAVFPQDQWADFDALLMVLLVGLFAAPTSAGVLMAMLKAAGLGGTWLHAKTRELAVWDDIETIMLMIPLQLLLVGFQWQLLVVGLVLMALCFALYRYGVRRTDRGLVLVRPLRLPTGGWWLVAYGVAIAALSVGIHAVSIVIDPRAPPVHLAVLLPAFVLGALMAHRKLAHEAKRARQQQRLSMTVAVLFMLLVGLSMPPMATLADSLSLGKLLVASVGMLILGNLGKMVALFFYRREASVWQRLTLGMSMWPRGEVGAGILIIAMAFGIRSDLIVIAACGLLLNMLSTPLVITAVKALVNARRA